MQHKRSETKAASKTGTVELAAFPRRDAAEKAGGKAEQEAQMSEPKASFCASRFTARFFGNRRSRQQHCGRLLLLTFLGETRKVSGRRAAPG